MNIAIPKEIEAEERRVSATPETVKKMVSLGLSVAVETGAGDASSIPDSLYTEAGASIALDPKELFRKADIVFKVRKPILNQKIGCHETDLLKEGALLIAFLQPTQNQELLTDI